MNKYHISFNLRTSLQEREIVIKTSQEANQPLLREAQFENIYKYLLVYERQ